MSEFITVAVSAAEIPKNWSDLAMSATGENAGAKPAAQSRDQTAAHAGLTPANPRCAGDAKLGLVRRVLGEKRHRTHFNG
jgi:hypothetical protein